MTVLVDTSVWSLALRRDMAQNIPEVNKLRRLVEGADSIVTTGLVLQELLQGFHGAKAVVDIIERFQALPFLMPDRSDHIAAAEIRNTCRRSGVQIGTVDAMLIQLCIRHDVTLLSTDKDFQHASRCIAFDLWRDNG